MISSQVNTTLIRHDRPNCIGCTACAAVTPKFWKMNEQDGLSDIIDGQQMPDGSEELEISDADLEENMNAAEVCPVNVIHLIKIGNGQTLI